ncbi:MAG: hypothetical protein JNL17_02435 [Cyclobacteriaceae bacterium]|nr:hypothetical protein [Cyclobacteriaceae bacterium]
MVNYGWSKDGVSAGIAGIGFGPNGVTFDAMQFAMAMISIATSYAGVAAAAKGEAIKIGAVAKEFAVSAAGSHAFSAGLSLAMGNATPTAPTSGHWEYSKREQKRVFYTNYWIWLDQTRAESMYGALYLQNASTSPYVNSGSIFVPSIFLQYNGLSQTLRSFTRSANNIGAASDVSYFMPDGIHYSQVSSPAVIATDNFSVKAPGIGGSIAPYRLDIGSVSVPREMTARHVRFSPVGFDNYKVPFVYQGSISNAYFHHSGGASSVTQPGFYLGQSHVANSSSLTYNLTDVIFQNQRVNPDVNVSRKIAQANHVEWLNNQELNTASVPPNGFMEYFKVSVERSSFRMGYSFGSGSSVNLLASSTNFTNGIIQLANSGEAGLFQVGQILHLGITAYNNITDWEDDRNGTYQSFPNVAVSQVNASIAQVTVNSSSFWSFVNGKFVKIEVTIPGLAAKRPNSIGGFSITSANGSTYHFALPVYDYEQKTYVIDVNDANKNSTIGRSEPFANTWLLTGITGPDFIDRGGTNGSPNGIIDDADWGYWVKFNYGRHTDNFQWRIPYGNNKFRKDRGNTSKTYSEGKKQLYYLNSVETRSHVALFYKDARLDSRGMNGSSSLLLKEIVLLSKEHYNKLISSYAMPDISGTAVGVLNVSDQPNFANKQSYIFKNAQKRVVFEYDYQLCPGTPNSVAPWGAGKLTLKRLSIRGVNDQKIVPDYLFEYGGLNPAYSEHAWDGWGMYNSAASELSHPASTNPAEGAAWSLTRVTTPLGATVDINYERDTYSSISGQSIVEPHVYSYYESGTVGFFGPSSLQVNWITVPTSAVASQFAPGDRIKILPGSAVSYRCPTTSFYQTVLGEFEVSAVISNKIVLTTSPVALFNCSGLSYGSQISIDYHQGTFQKVSRQRNGGNVRVASIVTRDGGIEMRQRYVYTNNGWSNGVVAQEPEWIKNSDLSFYNIPGYPTTPVMYSQVTVLSGKLTSDADFHTREVYNFETPNVSQMTSATNSIANFMFRQVMGFKDYLYVTQNNIQDYTSAIGRLNSMQVFDANGTLQSSLTNFYSNQIPTNGPNSYQGVYTQGTLMAEFVDYQAFDRHHKFNRTTVIRYPSVLVRSVLQKEGQYSSETENMKWDFISGQVIEKKEKNARGIQTLSVTQPLYRLSPYAEFGPKATNPANKNMVSAEGATYTYLLNQNGAQVGLIGASAQTWQKTWNNHRILNGSSEYVDQGTDPHPVWRKSAAYTFVGDYARLRSDGSLTFGVADQFNFSNPTPAGNPGWQYLGETKRYDRYSMPLETVDMNNISQATKMGYDGRIKLAEASNAEYNEIAFSSAEDKIPSIAYFGGEVGVGTGTVVSKRLGQVSETHTGDMAVSLNTNNSTFIYKSNGIKSGKAYRASVWTNSLNTRIYHRINGGAEVLSSAPTTAMRVGNWYLLHQTINTPATAITSFEVGVKSISGSVLVDDFRFQPSQASMVCYVYDPLDFEYAPAATTFTRYEYVLDNDHLFTRSEYNERGMLVKTAIESIKYNGVKLVSENKNDYKRFYTNP